MKLYQIWILIMAGLLIAAGIITFFGWPAVLVIAGFILLWLVAVDAV